MKVYEPSGMFQIKTVDRPWLCQGTVWFTQTLTGIYQLHVGYFDAAKKTLNVWKSRTIHPKIKMVHKGVRQHYRNPLLDQDIYERTVRLPFLQTSN